MFEPFYDQYKFNVVIRFNIKNYIYYIYREIIQYELSIKRCRCFKMFNA